MSDKIYGDPQKPDSSKRKVPHIETLVAISSGIEQARTLQAAYKGKLSDAYNAAAEVLHGLEVLKELSEEKFNFQIGEDAEGLHIKTNIPAAITHGYGSGTVDIHVKPNGRIRAKGDGYYYQETALSAEVGGVHAVSARNRKKATKKVLEFVSRKAAQNGMA